MGQTSDGQTLNLSWNYLPMLCPRVGTLLVCLLLFLASGCSNNTSKKWVEAEAGCVYESESPPLRRVVNYVDANLCNRQNLVKKEKQKRLRELINNK